VHFTIVEPFFAQLAHEITIGDLDVYGDVAGPTFYVWRLPLYARLCRQHAPWAIDDDDYVRQRPRLTLLIRARGLYYDNDEFLEQYPFLPGDFLSKMVGDMGKGHAWAAAVADLLPLLLLRLLLAAPGCSPWLRAALREL
jgi:hypothetical protein